MRSDERPRSVTMADVAERAGVSRALVSIVFRGVPGASPETRQRVMQAAEELDYRPDQRARLLGSNRSRTVGVVFGLRHEFHAEVVEALYHSVEATGYDLALGATAPARDERRAAQTLLDYRCEALILVGPTLPRAAVEQLAERLPVVVMARALRSPVRRRGPHRRRRGRPARRGAPGRPRSQVDRPRPRWAGTGCRRAASRVPRRDARARPGCRRPGDAGRTDGRRTGSGPPQSCCCPRPARDRPGDRLQRPLRRRIALRGSVRAESGPGRPLGSRLRRQSHRRADQRCAHDRRPGLAQPSPLRR